MRNKISKIGALVILAMFVFGLYTPCAFAGDLDETEPSTGSYTIQIDQDNDGTEIFNVTHHEHGSELFRIQEDGKVGIGDDDPDFKLEVVVTSGNGYFGVSTAKNDDGNIFIIDSSRHVGIWDTSPDAVLEIAESGTTPFMISNGASGDGDFMIVDTSGKVGIGITSPSHRLTIQSTDDNTLRLIGPDGVYGYGARINFGDQDFIYIEEDADDKLYIYSRYRTAIMGGDVGIGTTTPGAKLEVVATLGGAASIGSSCSASGTVAIATGHSADASGAYSTAMGYDTTASASRSTAMGSGTTASGNFSTAMGSATTASGDASTAMGLYTIASGSYSTAMGHKITAAGDYSFGIGLDATYRTITQSNTMAIMGGKVGICTLSPNNQLSVYGSADITGSLGIGTTSPSTKLHVDGDVAFELEGTPLTVTDPDDEVTVTHSYHLIDANSGYLDDLDTIIGGDVAGQILIITAAPGDTITVRNGEDNIILAVSDFELDDNDTLVLIYDGTTNWLEISRSDNS